MNKIVEFVLENGNLKIVLLDREEAQEIDNQAKGIDDKLIDLFEWQLCNGWSVVQPEEVGALTSALLISDDERIYYNPNYDVNDEVEDILKNGEIMFVGEPIQKDFLLPYAKTILKDVRRMISLNFKSYMFTALRGDTATWKHVDKAFKYIEQVLENQKLATTVVAAEETSLSFACVMCMTPAIVHKQSGTYRCSCGERYTYRMSDPYNNAQVNRIENE